MPLRLHFQLNVRTIHSDFVEPTPCGAGGLSTSPVLTLNLAPCQGQVTLSPSSSPSERGPPRCVQVLSMAWNLPSKLNRAIFFPCTSTNLPWLGSSSLACATLTYSAMLTSSIAQLSCGALSWSDKAQRSRTYLQLLAVVHRGPRRRKHSFVIRYSSAPRQPTTT